MAEERVVKLLEHCSQCLFDENECIFSSNCRSMKRLLQHMMICTISNCIICKDTQKIISMHSEHCNKTICPVPTCVESRMKYPDILKENNLQSRKSNSLPSIRQLINQKAGSLLGRSIDSDPFDSQTPLLLSPERKKILLEELSQDSLIFLPHREEKNSNNATLVIPKLKLNKTIIEKKLKPKKEIIQLFSSSNESSPKRSILKRTFSESTISEDESFNSHRSSECSQFSSVDSNSSPSKKSAGMQYRVQRTWSMSSEYSTGTPSLDFPQFESSPNLGDDLELDSELMNLSNIKMEDVQNFPYLGNDSLNFSSFRMDTMEYTYSQMSCNVDSELNSANISTGVMDSFQLQEEPKNPKITHSYKQNILLRENMEEDEDVFRYLH